MARAMKKALKDGGISPSQLDYICAAANSTWELDRAEALAIQKIFSGESRVAAVSSLKGHIGDFCGSGALRAAALLLSIEDGKIPPTVGLKDPEFELDHVFRQPRTKKIEYALLNGFSFGGSNVCLLFKKASP